MRQRLKVQICLSDILCELIVLLLCWTALFPPFSNLLLNKIVSSGELNARGNKNNSRQKTEREVRLS